MQFTEDAGLARIHPNIHAPACWEGVQELGGGGSGVTVCKGHDPAFGDIVFKHGAAHDTGELFALATIEQELRERGRSLGVPEAAAHMVETTPDFRFLYLSQSHFKSRGSALWSDVQFKLKQKLAAKVGRAKRASMVFVNKLNPLGQAAPDSPSSTPLNFRTASFGRSHSRPGKPIRVCKSAESPQSSQQGDTVRLLDHRLEVSVDAITDLDELLEDEYAEFQCSSTEVGYAYLQGVVQQLIALQCKHAFKFTLAQKAIGGPSATTGMILLLQGLLRGDLLAQLLKEYLLVIRYLQQLTYPQEVHVLDEVQREIWKASFNPAGISSVADSYVGHAIKKNFHPKTGRFVKLRDMGASFRSGRLKLTDGELLPGQMLGLLLKSDAQMEEVFASGLTGATALNFYFDSWHDLIHGAVNLKSEAAHRRIWTCGLTDGGLHNLFLEQGRLWLFDMGEPAVMPLPAFLTKFLMSFFHTLGMEETVADESSPGVSRSGWVNRFDPSGSRLALTPRTEEALAQAEAAFQMTLGCLIREVFDCDMEVTEMLIKYVILQLLSDAAFCLEKWQVKGGGSERGDGRAAGLEKWLWRVLWDLYVAGHIAGKDWAAELVYEDLGWE